MASSTVLDLTTKVLSATFARESWATWRAVLKAAHALPVSSEERAVLERLTGRETLLDRPCRELWLLLGRRSGKSIIAALCAVYATTCKTYALAPGEVGVFMVIAADRKQARVIKRYISGLLRSHPSLEVLIDRETQEIIWLTNGLCIEIHTCSFRSLRGYTCIGAAADEVAFWDDDDSANPDREVLIALRAAMASVPDAMLIGLTSVYARRGEVWRIFEKHFGRPSADVLVVNGATTMMNPTINQHVIDAAYEDDPIAAAAEYGAEFRRDVEVFLPPEALEDVRVTGRYELPLAEAHRSRYVAFIDPAGGTGQDSMTMAIAHDADGRAVLDLVREMRPPFSPEATVAQFAAVLKSYGLTTATSDRYAGSWPTEAFRKVGITVEPSTRTKSEIYQAVLPQIMSGTCELLDHTRLLKQFGGLERRTARGGKDSIDHAPRLHDDVANAAAGALVLVVLRPMVFDWKAAGMTSSATWDLDGPPPAPPPPPTPEHCALCRLPLATCAARKAADILSWDAHHAALPEAIEREAKRREIRQRIGWEVPGGTIIRDPFRYS